jgi:hypothetical protein
VWLTAIDSQHFSVTDKFDMIIGPVAKSWGVAFLVGGHWNGIL